MFPEGATHLLLFAKAINKYCKVLKCTYLGLHKIIIWLVNFNSRQRRCDPRYVIYFI